MPSTRLLVALLVGVLPAARAEPLDASKAECDRLMSASLPFARQMLETSGSFMPYGEAITERGRVVRVTVYDSRPTPPAAELIQGLEEGFRGGARNGEYRATAVVRQVRVRLPVTHAESDAIAVSLEHRNAYSVEVVYPYRFEGQQLRLGSGFASAGTHRIFVSDAPATAPRRDRIAADR